MIHREAPPEPMPLPRCPVCGEEVQTYYIGLGGEVVGCTVCVTAEDAVEWEEDEA